MTNATLDTLTVTWEYGYGNGGIVTFQTPRMAKQWTGLTLTLGKARYHEGYNKDPKKWAAYLVNEFRKLSPHTVHGVRRATYDLAKILEQYLREN